MNSQHLGKVNSNEQLPIKDLFGGDLKFKRRHRLTTVQVDGRDPAFQFVRSTICGRDSIEMTPVVKSKGRDIQRPPSRHKAEIGVKRAETGELSIDDS